MKKIIQILFLFLFLLLFAGCKKKDDTNTNTNSTSNPPPVTLGVNEITYISGDCGAQNVTVNTSNCIACGTNSNILFGQHTVSNNLTRIYISFCNSFVDFTGGGTGTYSTGTYGYVVRCFSGDSISCSTNKTYMDNSPTVIVTLYDAVNGLIEGTYSGTGKEMLDSTKTLTYSGKFSVIRKSDL